MSRQTPLESTIAVYRLAIMITGNVNTTSPALDQQRRFGSVIPDGHTSAIGVIVY